MVSEDLKASLIKVSKLAGSRGWCPGTSGNISVLNPDTGEVYIKISGRSMSDLKPTDILTLNLDGKVIDGSGRPSKEVNFHLGIYKKRKDVKAVLHTHPPYATAYATAGKPLPMVTATAKLILKKVPIVDYAPPGSKELADLVVSKFEDPDVRSVIMKNHGVVSVGADIYRALYVTEWVENEAETAFLSSIIKRLL